MALFDGGLSVTSYYGLEALALGADPPRYGNAHPSIVPYGVFEAADGPLVITVGNNAQFERFCRHVIERPDLADDPRFATNLLRTKARPELLPALEAELRARPRALLLQRLAAHGIPAGEVLGLNQALRSPRAAQAGMVSDSGGRGNPVRAVAALPDRRRTAAAAPAPAGTGTGHRCGPRRTRSRRRPSRKLRTAGIIA